jgi:hypothetical protein
MGERTEKKREGKHTWGLVPGPITHFTYFKRKKQKTTKKEKKDKKCK